MKLLLGIDLGTSYFKVGLFDVTGAMKGLARVSVHKEVPAPGWCELPVDRFWQSLRTGLERALSQAGATAGDIAGISYSSQANTFVLLDRDDRPLTPLVLWLDERGAPVEETLARFSASKEFRQTVGFDGMSGFMAAAKWRWWQRNRPETWKKVRRAMTLPDYFTFTLTGERAGDASTAAFLGLYDLGGKRWWPEALQVCGLDDGLLSVPLAPGSVCGSTTSAALTRLGLPRGVPFSVGGLDHHVAGLGSGLGRFAEASISTGTVLAAMKLVDTPTPREGCYHGPHFDNVRFYRLAFDPAGAGQLEDYQRQYAPDLSLEELVKMAATAPPCARPADGPRPGMSHTEHGAFVRCVLERVAASHRDLVGKIAERRSFGRIVATGGGARSVLWLQIKAAMLGVTVVRPRCPERASLGAAMLAGVGAGVFKNLDEASLAMVGEEAQFDPDPELARIYRGWSPDPV